MLTGEVIANHGEELLHLWIGVRRIIGYNRIVQLDLWAFGRNVLGRNDDRSSNRIKQIVLCTPKGITHGLVGNRPRSGSCSWAFTMVYLRVSVTGGRGGEEGSVWGASYVLEAFSLASRCISS